MGLIILGARPRQYPSLALKIDLAPPHLGDFIAALAGQDEQLHKRSKWPFDRLACRPDAPKFVVGQDAVATALDDGADASHGDAVMIPRSTAHPHMRRSAASVLFATIGAPRSTMPSRRP